MQPPIKQEHLGKTVMDANGEKLGMVGEIWLDDSTQEPEWIGVDMMGGTMHHVVPVAGSREDEHGAASLYFGTAGASMTSSPSTRTA